MDGTSTAIPPNDGTALATTNLQPPQGREQGQSMNALFEMPLQSEILTHDEIAELCGSPRRAGQVEWLTNNGWVFVRNRSGDPIVGRLYARLKLAGINPAAIGVNSGWVPDFSKVR